MAIKQVLFYPHSLLKTRCRPVTEFDDTFKQLVTDLVDTARHHNAEGLAAPQIGSDLRVFVLNTNHASGDEAVYAAYINPVIERGSDAVVNSLEGCLSFPNVFEQVTRLEWVDAMFHTMTGETQSVRLTGADAVAYQHERDHLDGIVFTERMGKVSRHLALKKHNKVQTRIQKSTKKMQELVNKLGKNNVVVQR
jgi:peptide deformylase